MENIVQFISSVGFPIAMCLLLWYDKHATLEKHTKMIEDLKDVIVENTRVTQALFNSISKE